MTLRIGISQIQNSSDHVQNLKTISDCIVMHQKMKSDLVAFPECALTGFTARVRDTNFTEIDHAINQIQKLVNQAETCVLLPTVNKTSNNEFLNSGFFLQPNQAPISIYKEGLTLSETKLFTPRSNASRELRIKNYKIGFLICIEAAHETWKYLKPENKPDLIIWPGYWGNEEITQWNEHLTNDNLLVYQNSIIWKTPLLQVTHSENHENIGIKPGPCGQSIIIDENNSLRHVAAKNKTDNFVVILSRTHDSKTTISGIDDLKKTSMQLLPYSFTAKN